MKLLKNNVSKYFLPGLLFTGTFIFYCFFYEQHLRQREQLQLFEMSFGYLLKKLVAHGGLADYLGEFLTQFFYIPFAGALIITGLLLLLYLVFGKLIRLVTARQPSSAIALMPSAGYLVLLTDNYYYLSGLVAVILALYAAALVARVKSQSTRIIMQIAMITATFWFAGGAYLVLVACLVAGELTGSTTKKRIVLQLLMAGFALILPVFAREIVFRDSLLHAYLSGSFHMIPVFFPENLIILFASFPLLILVQYFVPGRKLNEIVALGILTGMTLLIVLTTADRSEEEMMTYDNLAADEKWDEIIKMSEKKPPSGPVSLAAVNLALGMKSQLSEAMFRYDQTPNSLFLDYERRGMTPFFASEPYFRLGLYNFSRMFAMETVGSTPDAKYPSRSFRRVAETFLISGEYDLAMKYLQPLGNTLSQGRWASHYISAIESGDVEKDDWLEVKRKLVVINDFYYDAGRTDMALRYLLLSNRNNRSAYEYLVAHCLLQKDLDGFLQALSLAGEMGYESLPVTWQEAGAYIGTRIQLPPHFDEYSISNEVMNRLGKYAQAFSENSRDTAMMKREFGDTYWFYLHFR